MNQRRQAVSLSPQGDQVVPEVVPHGPSEMNKLASMRRNNDHEVPEGLPEVEESVDLTDFFLPSVSLIHRRRVFIHQNNRFNPLMCPWLSTAFINGRFQG